MVPYAPHGTTVASPTTISKYHCGLLLATSFFKNGKPNTACLNHVNVPDFEGATPATQGQSQQFFGTPNMWD